MTLFVCKTKWLLRGQNRKPPISDRASALRRNQPFEPAAPKYCLDLPQSPATTGACGRSRQYFGAAGSKGWFRRREVLPRPAAVACHKGRGRFKLGVVRALGNMLPTSA